VTTRPQLASFDKYSAVNWFSFYELRVFLSRYGFISFGRFDLMDLSKKGLATKSILCLLRGSAVLRWLAHVLTEGTIVIAVKNLGEDWQ
jgi:hypothetical protein